MPQVRYQQLLMSRVHGQTRWETATAPVRLEDLDRNQVLRMMRSGIASGRLPESTGQDIGDILNRLELRRDGYLLNAAAVLFGTEAALRDFPQCRIRLARFRGTTKSEFIDNRQLQGHAFVLLDEALAFLRRNSAIAARVAPDQLERVEQPTFPFEALREALVNALCHRDYAIIGGAISVAIYDDRLEIWSDGTLPFGLRVEDLKRDHLSRPRNPTIADVLRRYGLVEAWGRGTQKIVELCVADGHPEPEFVEQAGSVGVRFLAGAYQPPYRVGYDLTPRQRELLAILAQESALTSGDILLRLTHRIPGRTLIRELDELRNLGLVRSSGRTRGTIWSLEREHSR